MGRSEADVLGVCGDGCTPNYKRALGGGRPLFSQALPDQARPTACLGVTEVEALTAIVPASPRWVPGQPLPSLASPQAPPSLEAARTSKEEGAASTPSPTAWKPGQPLIGLLGIRKWKPISLLVGWFALGGSRDSLCKRINCVIVHFVGFLVVVSFGGCDS